MKVHIKAGTVPVYMWLYTASIKSTVGNNTRLFPSPFHVPTSSHLALAGAFRSDSVAACSTALRSANEGNESGEYVAVPCPFKVKQHSSTANWLKVQWRHQIGYYGTHTEQKFSFKVKLCNNS